MELRIVVGKSGLLIKHAELDSLKTLYRSSKLIIQGNDNVATITLKDGRKVFLAGNLVGIRTSQYEMISCSNISSRLEELIRTSSVEECQNVLEGRFILVIVGLEDKCTVFADRYGRKDLYYHVGSGSKVFASDLSLLSIPLAGNGYDQVALAHTLTVYGFRPPKRHTFYRSIRRLGVGEVVRIEGDKVDFSEIEFKPKQTGKYGKRELDQYADILLDAIRVRSSHYGNVVYLSSGWDSTAILACLVHLYGAKKVRAVILRILISERSGVFNKYEIDRAQVIADYYGVRLDIVDADQRHKVPPELEKYRSVLKLHNSPSMSVISHGILADFVSRTSNGDEAVFAGEISDGAHNLGFSQYTTILHPVLEFREYSDKMASYLFGPSFLGLFQTGQFMSDPVYNLLRGRVKDDIFDDPATGSYRNRNRQLLSNFFLRAKRLPLWSLHNNSMLTEEGSAEYSEELEGTYLKHAAEKVTQNTLYAWYLHLYNSFHWQSSSVNTLSLTAEANGFHLALPFWDSRLQDFLSAMPETWGRGLDLNHTKYPLKWMLKNRIDYPMHLQVGPHAYLYDHDISFNTAWELLHASAIVPYFKKHLKSRFYRDLISHEMFDLNYIDRMVDNYLEGYEICGNELNDLISICLLSLVV